MLKTIELTKSFRSDEIETIALNKVSFEVKEGEFVAIMGPSGCGKSTLLNLLGLLDNPTRGQLYFFDYEVSNYSERKRTILRKENIGFVFQSFNLIDELSVYENVELPLLYLKMPAQERKQKVEQVLERMQIAHRRRHFPQQLSGGQQQRVAVARAVVMDLLTRLNENGTTIVMVTHSPSDAERAHRIVQLFDGHIVTENLRKNKF